jgi:hypothetical protein
VRYLYEYRLATGLARYQSTTAPAVSAKGRKVAPSSCSALSEVTRSLEFMVLRPIRVTFVGLPVRRDHASLRNATTIAAAYGIRRRGAAWPS